MAHDKPSPPQELQTLAKEAKQKKLNLVIAADANSHHTIWGSKDINDRDSFKFDLKMSLMAKCELWVARLKSSSAKKVSECIIEILQEIPTILDNKMLGFIAGKLLFTVCKLYDNGGTDFRLYYKVFTELAPFMVDVYFEKFISYFRCYITRLINKKQWNEALTILSLVDQIKLKSTTEINHYFEIHTNYYSVVIPYSNNGNFHFKVCIVNILKSLKAAKARDPELFQAHLNDIFGIKNQFTWLLRKYFDDSKEFLKSVIEMMATMKGVTDIQSFTINRTSYLVFLLTTELENGNKPILALSYLNAVMKVIETAGKKEPMYKMLTLIYLLIKVIGCIDTEEFNTLLQGVLSKIGKMLATDTEKVAWVTNSTVTVCEILRQLIPRAYEKLNSESIVEISELFIQFSKILPHTDSLKVFNKTVCSNCSNISKHVVFNVAHCSALLYRKWLELKFAENTVDRVFLMFFKYAVSNCIDIKCIYLDSILHKLCAESCKALRLVDNSIHGAYAIKTLEILENLEKKPEFLVDIQLIYLYKSIFPLVGKHKTALEMSCLYVVHLLNRHDHPKSTILLYLVMCIAQYKDAGCANNLNICDILDRAELQFEIPAYDRKKAIRWQFEASTQATTDAILRETLAKAAIDQTENEIELGHVVGMLGKITIPDLLPKIKTAIQQLKNKLLTDKNELEKKYLALGQLYMRWAIFKLERAKKIFTGDVFSEAKFSDIDCNRFKNVDINAENKILIVLIEARENYEKFSSLIDRTKAADEYYNWEKIIDDISYLARHFILRGYIQHAYKAWLIVYEISNLTSLKLHRIRAISFFAEYSHIIEHLSDCIDLTEAISETSEDIIKAYHELDSYLPRRKNYVMLSIINIALFYSRHDDIHAATLLAEMAKKKRDEMLAQKNESELISANLMAFNFHILTKCCDHQANIIIMPYTYLYSICDEIRNIQFITSEDSVNIPAFLFRITTEMTQFLMQRLCSVPMKPFLYSLLKVAGDLGLGLRMAEMVSLLACIDLQMELVESCQPKLIILDLILTNELQSTNRTVEESPSLSCSSSVMKKQSSDAVVVYQQLIEPTRKAAPKSPLSPKNFKLSLQTTNIKTDQYLLTHPSRCACAFCFNPMFRMIAFQVGCLHARCYYVTGDYTTCELFLEKSFDWWQQLNSPVFEILFHDGIFSMIVFYLNVLRRLNLYTKALRVLEVTMDFFKKYSKLVDTGIKQNLTEQRMCIMKSMAPLSKRKIKEPTILGDAMEVPLIDPSLKESNKPVVLQRTRIPVKNEIISLEPPASNSSPLAKNLKKVSKRNPKIVNNENVDEIKEKRSTRRNNLNGYQKKK